MSDSNDVDLIHMTADIVTAYVSNHTLRASELSDLISTVYSGLTTIGEPRPGPAAVEVLTPAVPIKKSITPEYLICLDDGKKFKSMKRHLAQLGLTPDQYRAKWGLPASYPMVAPGYAAKRSALARTMGLGRKAEPALLDSTALSPAPEAAATLAPVLEAMEAEPTPVKRRGRPKKALAEA